jgi:hypothetical protein
MSRDRLSPRSKSYSASLARRADEGGRAMALREIQLNRSIAGTDETEKSHGELPTEAVTHRSRPLRSSKIATTDAGTLPLQRQARPILQPWM